MNPRLVPNDITALARIEIDPLEISISGEEILTDLLYPASLAQAAERPG